MEIKEAVKKAIEGGWAEIGYCEWVSCNQAHSLLDPKFWQSLGKTIGWVEVCDNPDHGFIESMPGEIGRLGCPLCGHNDDYIIESTRDNWRKEWHKFIDFLADGKTPEEYFAALK